MHGDMFQHAVVSVGDRQFDVRIRDEHIERGAFEEVYLVFEDFQVLGFDIGRDVHARGALAHLGFDVELSLFARHRYAMMPVHHEIDLPHFIEDDRWEADFLIEGAVDALPAVGEFVGGGEEDAVEFVIAVQTPRDLIHPNGLHAPINGSADVEFLLDVVVREEGGAPSRKGVADAVQERLEEGTLKIGA